MRTLLVLFGLGAAVWSHAQNTIRSYEYWFNNNFTSLQRQNVSPAQQVQLNTNISTADLADGIHLLHMRFRDDSGRYSPAISQFFYKPAQAGVPANTRINAWQYWFDEQFTFGVTEVFSETPALSLNRMIHTDHLADGLHLFFTRFRDNLMVWSPVLSHFFYKIPAVSTGSNQITGFQYWFNDQFQNAVTETITATPAFTLSSLVSASSLPEGIHLFHIRFRDSRGQWSSVLSQFVYNQSPSAHAQGILKQMQYWFNRDEQQAVTVAIPNQPSIQVTQIINAATLPDGLHILHLRFADTTGKWTPVISQFFYKSAEFGITNNVITGYRYWFNDASVDNMVYQPISPVNPFSLVTVVDMGCLTNGNNRLVMQFRDSTGNWSAPMVDTVNVTAPVDKSLRFVGNGNWSNADNWLNKMKPSPNAPGCREIIIDHVAGGSCILDVPQRLLKNAKLIVLPGKKLIIPGNIETAPEAPVNLP